jgi:hypothetical protein
MNPLDGCELSPLYPLSCNSGKRLTSGLDSNFWNTTEQEKIIAAIGTHYHFTRRLGASIRAWDKYREAIRQVKNKKNKIELENSKGLSDEDLEQGISDLQEMEALPPSPADLEELNNFMLIQNSINYTTVDHGEQCELIFMSLPYWRQC